MIFEYPGGVALSELAARDLTANALALKLRLPANRLSEVVRGRRAISAETALRLGRFFGNAAGFWMALQAHYDLAVAREAFGAAVDREVELEDT